jgi:hypothetical protein
VPLELWWGEAHAATVAARGATVVPLVVRATAAAQPSQVQRIALNNIIRTVGGLHVFWFSVMVSLLMGLCLFVKVTCGTCGRQGRDAWP